MFKYFKNRCFIKKVALTLYALQAPYDDNEESCSNGQVYRQRFQSRGGESGRSGFCARNTGRPINSQRTMMGFTGMNLLLLLYAIIIYWWFVIFFIPVVVSLAAGVRPLFTLVGMVEVSLAG